MNLSENLADLFAAEYENDWRSRAACRTLDPNLFFAGDAFENKSEKEAREAEAKAVCAGCGVRQDCLDYSFAAGERYGIWGGMNASERRTLLRRRNRRSTA